MELILLNAIDTGRSGLVVPYEGGSIDLAAKYTIGLVSNISFCIPTEDIYL